MDHPQATPDAHSVVEVSKQTARRARRRANRRKRKEEIDPNANADNDTGVKENFPEKPLHALDNPKTETVSKDLPVPKTDDGFAIPFTPEERGTKRKFDAEEALPGSYRDAGLQESSLARSSFEYGQRSYKGVHSRRLDSPAIASSRYSPSTHSSSTKAPSTTSPSRYSPSTYSPSTYSPNRRTIYSKPSDFRVGDIVSAPIATPNLDRSDEKWNNSVVKSEIGYLRTKWRRMVVYGIYGTVLECIPLMTNNGNYVTYKALWQQHEAFWIYDDQKNHGVPNIVADPQRLVVPGIGLTWIGYPSQPYTVDLHYEIEIPPLRGRPRLSERDTGKLLDLRGFVSWLGHHNPSDDHVRRLDRWVRDLSEEPFTPDENQTIPPPAPKKGMHARRKVKELQNDLGSQRYKSSTPSKHQINRPPPSKKHPNVEQKFRELHDESVAEGLGGTMPKELKTTDDASIAQRLTRRKSI